MLEGIYNNAANLNMIERWQASISQNLANSQAAGFKRSQFSVNTEPTSKTNSAGVNAAIQPKSQERVDLSPGAIRRTDKDTDVAIDGPGFFQVQGTNGQMLYTRNGEFHFNPHQSTMQFVRVNCELFGVYCWNSTSVPSGSLHQHCQDWSQPNFLGVTSTPHLINESRSASRSSTSRQK